ncbi:MAG: cardiolipin synthase [Clostridia bacterium]|nr:cardiolipin synthase [Clostridia bacterium]
MKFLNRALNRFVLVTLSLALQMALLFWFSANMLPAVDIIIRILSVFAVCYVISNSGNSEMKLSWTVVILVLPVFGTLLYLLTGGKRPARRLRRRCESVIAKNDVFVIHQPENEAELAEKNEHLAAQAHYLDNWGFPLYKNTDAVYFPLGDDMYPVLLEELQKAEKFIFMEYFILNEGEMLQSVLGILEKKAAEGVEVRLIYDDVGSVFNLPYGYDKKLEERGIKCHAFNPYVPIFSSVMNNRDHRKICVIDSKVGFTGGINLADEYINKIEKFGHWKDNAVMLKGVGVWGLTMMFLDMWNAFRPEDADLNRFRAPLYFSGDDCGFVQPFGDSPLDDELVSENVYMNAINAAQKYIYIYTPYLIPDRELTTALCLAAKKGVDVKLIVPGIPDKKAVYAITKSYYGALIRGGVKIYKYLPGFVHAKGFVADDIVACGGTINLDFRSLYHHFECGCMFYYSPVVGMIKKDFEETLEKCERIEKYQKFNGLFGNMYHAIMRLIAPLL